jgi:hypothetical protein
MEECNYWVQSDGTQWCDLIDETCACGGSGERCRIKGQSIADVMRLEEQITFKEASVRAQKRRLKEAS